MSEIQNQYVFLNMDFFKIALLDDNELVVITLKKMLKKLGYNTVYSAYHFDEAIELINKVQPHLFLLDINLQTEKTGIDFANLLKTKFNTPFIFITSDTESETISKAVNTSPIGYLTKPVRMSELESIVKLATIQIKTQNNYKSDGKHIIIKPKNIPLKLYLDEILYIKSEHVYSKIILKNDTQHLVRNSLKKFEEVFGQSFIRIHKSYIINQQYIEKFDSKYVYINTVKIPIGKKYYQFFKDSISKLYT